MSASVAEARRRVVGRLSTWGVDAGVRDNAELVVSELFTNAVCHTSSEEIGCYLQLRGTRLRLAVSDQGCAGSEPRARRAGADQEGGRGLALVDALSHAWGVRPDTDGPGRVVWARLA
ncbi:ATP-binding protein [Streptomyces sp. B1866]|uniref:ATP-binding protein n=1 Tax=Streptomyces sp. B1866 TaxID=3075431 RepID=UPI00288F09F4|nr:ATP-binding protein [Streptomyces sp. B1866]MDT3399966.1 ATP-binding protein [Streptomyces sp. B1866]